MTTRGVAGVLAISCDPRGRASPRDAETVAARQTEAVPLHFFERHLPRPRGAGGPPFPVEQANEFIIATTPSVNQA